MAEEQPNKEESNKVLIISLVIIGLFVVGLLTNGFGIFSMLKSSPTINLTIGNAPVLGDANAPVTIFEFSDFSCPYCAAAAGYNPEFTASLKANDQNWEAPIPAIEEQYVKTGKVKIVFKYFPGHGSGQAAHKVAFCLNEQGLFWTFHDQAFANQEDTGSLNKMTAIAQTLGADMTLLDGCLASGKYDSRLAQDTAEGNAAGVRGTPMFFINGEMIEGAQSFAAFKKIIDKKI